MTTKDLIEQILEDTRNEQIGLIHTKRNGTEYVEPYDLEDFIHNNYVIFLCTKILKIINKGHDRQALIQAMEITDWVKYSFSGHAYTGMKKLCSVLGIKPKKSIDVSDLLFQQGWELKKASDRLVDSLKELD